MSECKAAGKNECQGMNSCAGMGYITTETQAACDAARAAATLRLGRHGASGRWGPTLRRDTALACVFPTTPRSWSTGYGGADFVEAVTENFLGRGGRPRAVLERVRRDVPVALHGVSLSIGGTSPLNERYLDELRVLCDRIEPVIVSDHLCFGTVGRHYGHDLWPLPYTEEARGSRGGAGRAGAGPAGPPPGCWRTYPAT